MRKRVLAVLLCVALCVGMIPVGAAASSVDKWDGKTVASAFSGGSGTSSAPYLISSCAELVYLANELYYSNDTDSIYYKKYFKLTCDLDMGGYTFSGVHYFGGSFNGNGHTISGLNIQRDDTKVGLFGWVQGGEIKNLTVAGVIRGTQHVGGIAGCVSGVSSGSLTNYAYITNCVNYCTVSYTSSRLSIGGVVGCVFSNGYTVKVQNCKNYGEVIGGSRTGGIVGYLDDVQETSITSPKVTISLCGNAADISGTGHVGGIVGHAEGGKIERCGNAGNISGYGNYVGGIVGELESGANTGGSLSAYHKAIISNCYNSGTVYGSSNYIGGVCGAAYGNNGTEYLVYTELSNLYNAGKVSSTGSYDSEIAYGGAAYLKCSNLFFLSGINSGLGNVVGAAGLSEENMKLKSSFSGFTFSSSYWGWDSTGGYAYPILVGVGPLERVHCDHDYSASFKWSKTSSGYSVVGYLTCSHDSSHIAGLTCTVSSTTTEATCTAEGKIEYTVSGRTVDNKYYSGKKIETIPMLGHTYDEYGICTVCGAAEYGQCGDNLYWKVDGTALVISGSGDMWDYSEENPSPWTQLITDGKVSSLQMDDAVTRIGDYAFLNWSGLYSVTLPSALKSVGEKAFFKCCLMGDLKISATVERIGSYAFRGCGGTGVLTVMSGNTVLEEYAFANTLFTEVVLPEGMTAIPVGLFTDNAALTKVTLPSTLRKIGHHAFAGCTQLQHIYLAGCTGTRKLIEIESCGESGCGGRLSAAYYTALKDHTYGEWIRTVEPTYTTAGEEECICSMCGGKKTREVAPTGPALVEQVIFTYDPDSGVATVIGIPEGVTVVLAAYNEGRFVISQTRENASGTKSFVLSEGLTADTLRVFFMTSDFLPMGGWKELNI